MELVRNIILVGPGGVRLGLHNDDHSIRLNAGWVNIPNGQWPDIAGEANSRQFAEANWCQEGEERDYSPNEKLTHSRD